MKPKIIITGVAALIFLVVLIGGWFYWRGTDQVMWQSSPSQEIRVLRLGHAMPGDSVLNHFAQRFAAEVLEKSDGRLKVEIFPNQQLGNNQQMIEMARSGQLEILLTPTAQLSIVTPAMQYVDLPFLFPTREDAYKMLDGTPGKMLLDQLLPIGLVGATFWDYGFKQFAANKSIDDPKDFIGLNIRVMKSRIIMEQFKALGANPIPIDFHTTYQALKDGVVDGQEMPLVGMVSMKFYEVQPYLTISNHAYLASVFCFSKEVYYSLAPDLQNILMTTAREITPLERQETSSQEDKLLRIIKEAGTKVHILTAEQRHLFQAATEHIIDEYKYLIGPKIVDLTRTLLRKKHQIQPANTIKIGLDADLSSFSPDAGEAIKRGIKLAVQEINQGGGVLGKLLAIIVRDHASLPDRGQANLKYFSQVENLVAVMGGKQSSVVLAELDIIHQQKIVLLIPWAAATSVIENGFSPNYVFRISARDELAGGFLVNRALELSPRIALLLDNNIWGRSNQQAMTESLAKKGLKPTAVEWVNRMDKNLMPQLTRIKNSGAEVILLAVAPAPGVSLVKNMAMRDLKIPLVSHWGIIGGDFWNSVHSDLNGIQLEFLQTFSFINPRSQKTREFIHRYKESYDVDSPNKILCPTGTAHAYDLVHLLAMAIKQAGSLDRSAIRDVLEQIEFHEGLVKTYAPPFTPDRHDALDQSDYFMATFDEEGGIIPVTTPSSVSFLKNK